MAMEITWFSVDVVAEIGEVRVLSDQLLFLARFSASSLGRLLHDGVDTRGPTLVGLGDDLDVTVGELVTSMPQLLRPEVSMSPSVAGPS
jgi:hypothetical protein